MPSRKDNAAELGEKLVSVLEAQRRLGPDAYPLSVECLTKLADSLASPSQIEKALAKKIFQSRAVVACRKSPGAPVALDRDLELLAGSRLLLEFMLRLLRTPSNHAFSVAGLKAKLTARLQKPFHIAINRQMEEGLLPPTIGWLLINRSKKLFLLADLHAGQQAAQRLFARAPEPQPAAAPDQLLEQSTGFAELFDRAFGQLDRQAGAHNFVSLVELRRAVPVAREIFDSELRRLRLAGRYSLSAAEGRHGLSSEEREAGILEGGSLLLYVARKTP